MNEYIHEWIPAQIEEVSKQLDFNILQLHRLISGHHKQRKRIKQNKQVFGFQRAVDLTEPDQDDPTKQMKSTGNGIHITKPCQFKLPSTVICDSYPAIEWH